MATLTQTKLPRPHRLCSCLSLILLCIALWQGCTEPPPVIEPSTPVTLNGNIKVADRTTGILVPLAGATLTLDAGSTTAAVEQTDSAGTFIFPSVVPEKHRLQISHATIVTMDTVLSIGYAPNQTLQFVCVPAWASSEALGGIATWYDYHYSAYVPLAGATVWLDSGTVSASSRITDSTGGFAFPLPAPGNHGIKVSDARVVSKDIAITVKSASDIFRLQLPCEPALLPFQGYVQRVAEPDEYSVGDNIAPPQLKYKRGVDAVVTLDGHDSVRTIQQEFGGYFDLGMVSPGQHRLKIQGPEILPVDTLLTFTTGQAGNPNDFANKLYFIVTKVLPPVREFIYPLAVGQLWRYAYTYTSFSASSGLQSSQTGIHTWQVVNATPDGSGTIFTINDARQDTVHRKTYYSDTTYTINETQQFTIVQTADSLFLNLPAFRVPRFLRLPRFHNRGTDTLIFVPTYSDFYQGSVVYISGIGLSSSSLSEPAHNSGSSEQYALIETR